MIIPGEGVLNEFLFLRGRQEVDGVAVLDAVGLLWKHAEFVVDLQRSLGVRSGRRSHYAVPPREVLDQVWSFYGVHPRTGRDFS